VQAIAIRRRICPRCQASIRRSGEIMSISVRHGFHSGGTGLARWSVIARVERRHRSREFIALLKDLDAHYPAEAVIRLILDNHSATSPRKPALTWPHGPIAFVMCIPHTRIMAELGGNLVGKMARTFLRGMRVPLGELRERILRGITEINVAPVVHRWRKFEALEKPL